MGLRLRDGVDINELRKYGFELGSVLGQKDSFSRCLGGVCYAYMDNWAHKFLMDEEEPEKVAFTDEDFDIPMVHISFRLDEKYDRDLYIDVAPSGTYHIGGSDLDIVADTIFEMTFAGLLEKVREGTE